MEDDEEDGFTLDWREACALLGCSQSHFYNLVNAGGIPAVRNGRRKSFRVRREDCLRYLTGWREPEGFPRGISFLPKGEV